MRNIYIYISKSRFFKPWPFSVSGESQFSDRPPHLGAEDHLQKIPGILAEIQPLNPRFPQLLTVDSLTRLIAPMMEQKWWQIIVPRIRLEDSNRPLEHTPGTAKKYKDFLHKQVFLRVWGMFQVYVRNFPREWSWNSTFCTEEVLELPQSQWQHDYEVKWWKRCRSNAETFWSKTWTCGCFNISKFGDVTFTPFLSMEKNHGLKKL